jgi:ribonuclease BN (tRNA processing enzyme)
MRLQLLPSTIDEDGRASARQHLLSIIINDRVAVDAGSLAFACSDLQRRQIRDIVLTHTHLDHIAGLPMFIDDLFATLTEPIRIHATSAMIETLERDIFNWSIYPRFSELSNSFGPVVEYREFKPGDEVALDGLTVRGIPVNHRVDANGFLISDGKVSVAITGDTASTDAIWQECGTCDDLAAVFVECAFPDELAELAGVSYHLTPYGLKQEVSKLNGRDIPVYVINLKPMYRDRVIEQIEAADMAGVEVLEVGRVYEF